MRINAVSTMLLSEGGCFYKNSQKVHCTVDDMNSSGNAPIRLLLQLKWPEDESVLLQLLWSSAVAHTAILHTWFRSSLHWAHKVMTSAGLAVPDLPLCPSPHQDALFAPLHLRPRRCFSPVSVVDWLASCPLPSPSALPVIQTWNSGWKNESVRVKKLYSHLWTEETV